MNKFISLVKAHPLVAGAAVLALLCLVWWLGAGAINSVERAVLNSKIGSLEREKSAAETRAAAAERRALELEGQIQLRTQDLEAKNAEIEASAQRLALADAETSRRAALYRETRNRGPRFRNPDPAGRIRELRADADELYPANPPASPH